MATIIGTELDDPNLQGTAADDTISGLGGRDHLNGGAGNDTLLGGAGDDAMHGDAGADTMFGGAGNDDYYVDDVNDVVSETTVAGVDDGGNDRVYSTASYSLSPFLERLVLLESAGAISATGNAQVNTIVGNSNANIISGGGAKDTLTGGAGADTFVLGLANAANTVTITDFAAEDRFGITASDYGLTQGSGLVDNGSGTLVLDPTWFATVTGTQGTAAGHGQFLYNTTTRSMMWDADGSGPASGIALATLQTGAVVTAANFAISGATSNPGVGNISINDVNITEGNSGTQVATFTVTRSGGTAAFNVNYATADGTATAGSDYVAQPTSTLSFAAGDLTKTVSVTINGDTTVEPDETFSVNLSGATNGGTITKSQGTGTIVNDDAAAGVGSISINDVSITEGNSGTKVATFTVSHTGSAAFSVDYATANSTAGAGTSGTADYVATSGTLNFAAGTSTQTVSVTIRGDTTYEPNETFFVNLTGATNGGTILDGQGLGTIVNDDTAPVGPHVVAAHDMAALGSTDPSGIAYVPGQGLFISDSEVEESPFLRSTNLWKLQPDGTLLQSFSLLNFTHEPTGLAFDSSTGRLYIPDDDEFKMFWVDPGNPTVKLGEFDLKPLGCNDPEDVAVNPNNGHLFIINGSAGGRLLVEVNNTGTQVFSSIVLPAEIKDAEALGYDASHDVFYVGGGFSPDIWVVDRSGNILQKLDVLEGYRNPVGPTSAHVKDLELAPSSDPNDDPGTLNLYVADYGNSHVSDGRLLEIANPFFMNAPASLISTNSSTTVQSPQGSMTPSGVQVTDADTLASSQAFSLTATTGTAGTSTTPPTSSGSLTSMNSVLATGVTSNPGVAPPSTDSATPTVKDNFGATDTENFVFAQAGAGPNITPQGTSGKDVILATNSQDVLTGTAAQDQFVFTPAPSGPSVQHTITDFQVGIDKIDVRQFSNISASALPTETQHGSDTLVTLDGNDTLLLKNVAAVSLHASDFIVHA